MIRVMLVNDLYIQREGLRSILFHVSDIEIVGSTTDGEEMLTLFDDARPDVILMDMDHKEMDGLKAGVAAKDRYPEVKIIYLTRFIEEDLVITALNGGADGFLHANADANIVIQTVRNVSNDQIVINGKAARILARRISDTTFDTTEVLDRKLKARNIILTILELEIACLLMEDKTNHQIAQHMHLSEGTIKNYISEVYFKLNTHRRPEVIDYLCSLFVD